MDISYGTWAVERAGSTAKQHWGEGGRRTTGKEGSEAEVGFSDMDGGVCSSLLG